ncbi:MAG: SRPBCC family protein [Solirubrobacteraceae bacterium]
MRTWTAQTVANGRPEDVLAMLTDPEAVSRWAPIDFVVEGLDGPRLETGSRARVVGRLAGQEVGFDVDVHAAGPHRFELTASGPIALDVAYDVLPAGDGSQVVASIGVRGGRGLTGRLIAHATDALLAGGALHHAVSRMAREVDLIAA